MADPYLIFVNDRIAGYGAVWNMYQKDRLMEFHTLPSARGMAATLFRELLVASQATHIEAQTNMPWMLMMLYDHARNITTESILFQDVFLTNLACPGAVLRRSTYDDAPPCLLLRRISATGSLNSMEPSWPMEAFSATTIRHTEISSWEFPNPGGG